MIEQKTAVLLVNLGTPKSTKVSDVRSYLRQFLMDARVIDIPFVQRFLLVNGIIAPFRSFRSAREYKKVWTENGSPLLFYGLCLRDKLQESLGNEYHVALGMRYQEPSIEVALSEFKKYNIRKIIVFPLFPQYASATTGSVHQEVMRILSKEELIPELHFVTNYPTLPKMVRSFAEQGRIYLRKKKYDHILFSYHGLPERQLKKSNPKCLCKDICCEESNDNNALCYRAQCLKTSKAIAKELGYTSADYTNCFQSRLGKTPWIKPYTEDVIRDLARKGYKRLLVFSPAFVADCLETIVEVGEEYKELFQELGGKELDLVSSLNAQPLWVEAVKGLIGIL